ncbi:MAG: thiol-disulfide isomerase/thioredoxin [Mariniblastus sp.]|jgi:thiol-disulfide isomerase/thioredoxin
MNKLFTSLPVWLISALVSMAICHSAQATDDLAGLWDASIKCKGGEIKFGLDLEKSASGWQAHLVNGEERIKIPTVEVTESSVRLRIDHYDSELKFQVDQNATGPKLNGKWKKRRGPDKWSSMTCSAVPHDATSKSKLESPTGFNGRWAVKFESSDDPAVGVFNQRTNSNQVLGTFLTTTGDYRFLAGGVQGGQLELSCFDGAHAFLFKAKRDQQGNLIGDFWSSAAWHETWSANLDPQANLPDDFKQTIIVEGVELGAMSFPDLNGKLTKLDDPKFAGKARIIYVFGSWCPNCHDAGAYFATLDKKYRDQGLSILGLAFELTGDFDRDAAQVKTYLGRHGSNYPVLVAGLSDKAEASKSLPILDRVRSYPTTIFLDGQGQVTAVHTGFTGPATGEAYELLKAKFERLIQRELKKN